MSKTANSQTAHAESLREFQDWNQRRAARREARRAHRQAVTAEICREQFATTARRLQRLGFAVELPLDFTRDTLATSDNAAGASGTVLASTAARENRYGFGLPRRDWSPAQRAARLRLAVVWFLAVIAVFAGYLSLPAAQADTKVNTAAVQMAPHAAEFTARTTNTAATAGMAPHAPAAAAPRTQSTPRTQVDPNNPNNPGQLTDPNRIGPNPPRNPANPEDPALSLTINGFDKRPSTTVLVFMLITVLSVAPSLLLMMTSFTKIFIVLAMARNALGLNQIPPTQVLSGLAVFLSLFIMSPTIGEVWNQAIQPYMDGRVQIQETFKLGEKPFRDFMGPLTREEDIALMTRAADRPNPPSLDETPFTTLVPAFMISEVRSAFIIGFVVFIPFLVIDLVVGAALMSMGMMMLPPVMVSLPFKVLLFVMVDGWGMLTQTLIGTYR